MFLIFWHAEGTVFGLAIRNPELTASGPRQPNLKGSATPQEDTSLAKGAFPCRSEPIKAKTAPALCERGLFSYLTNA